MLTFQEKRKLIVPSIILALVALLLIGVGAYRQGRANAETADWVRHTYQALGELTSTLSLVQDVETSARGYIITGRESYLEPFQHAEPLIQQKLQSLRHLTRDNPEQQRRLDTLGPLVERKVAISREQVALRREKDALAAEQSLMGGEGKQVMDEIRAVIAEMEAIENQLLLTRTQQLQASNVITLGFFLVLIALLAGLLAGAIVLVRRYAAAQQREMEITEAARSYAQDIVDTIRKPLLVLDADLRVRSGNRAFYQVFRVEPRETEGCLLQELGDRQWDIPELRRLLEQVLPWQKPFEGFEIEREFPGIGRRTMLLNARKMYRMGNHTDTILLAIEDVTERKLAEEERDRVFSLSRDLICIAGFDGYFKRVNPAWTQTLGYTAEELLAIPYLEFVHPEDVGATLAEAGNLTTGQEVISFENRYRCKDGSYRWLLWSAAPAVSQQAAYAVAHDITERKRNEALLRKSHQELQDRFGVAVRASGQVLYEREPQTGAISFANVEALGYTEEEMGNRLAHWLDMVHPDDREAFQRELDRSARTESPFHLEYRISRKKGDYVFVEDRGYFTSGQNGHRARMVGFIADISERKNLESQFRQAQKMDAVGRLAGGVAHDFNNLLGVILGFSDLLRDRVEGDERARTYLDEVRRASESAAKLTRQLLAFSRKQVLEPQILDLNTIISDHAKMLRRMIGEDIQLSIVTAPDLEPVKADPGQVEQVILNLVVNARDAMPKGGKLTIETANVTLDETYAGMHVAVEPGRYVMFAVSDSGIGMDAATQQRIFEPFFTTKKQGTGLGLATVYGIVKQSGGNIWVYSEPGQGTTFRVYLPLAERQSRKSPADAPLAALPRGSETILLVEDSDSLRKAVREFLERAGYEVLEAPHGGAAVQIAEHRRKPIDLLVSDVVMPGMGGREAAEQVRQYHPDIKVLYMSGYTDDAILRQGVEEKGISLLAKPFAAETIVRRVRLILDSPALPASPVA